MSVAENHPVACTLDSADMPARLTRIRRLSRMHLRAYELTGSRLRLSYDRAAANEVAQVVELERQCCAFLDFVVWLEPASVELQIDGPPLAQTPAAWLFAQFLPEGDRKAEPPSGCACCG